MKRFIGGILFLVMLALAGCGGGLSSIPPLLSNLQYFQDQANPFQVDGNVDFSAPEVDLDSMSVTVVDSITGVVVSQFVIPLPQYSGFSVGTIPFYIDASLLPSGPYSFSVQVIDVNGFLSNPLYGSFTVTAVGVQFP